MRGSACVRIYVYLYTHIYVCVCISVSIGLVTPFYSASLVETVQSEIASESPGILDVFRDGAIRLVEVSNKGRLIPIYSLLPPTIAYGVSKYLFTLAVQGVTSRIMHIRQKHTQELTVSLLYRCKDNT